MANKPEEISKDLHDFFSKKCIRYGCYRDEEKGWLHFGKVKKITDKEIVVEKVEKDDKFVEKLKVGGVYVFFQKGETYNNTSLDRIVRVGISSNLYNRLHGHFCADPSNSVFSRKVGYALLYKDLMENGKKYSPKLFAEWAEYNNSDEEHKKLREDVSKYMRENFFFAVMAVPDEEKRKELEEKIISTISRDRKFKSTDGWDGNYLNRGLWLDQGLKGDVLSDENVKEIKNAVF